MKNIFPFVIVLLLLNSCDSVKEDKETAESSTGFEAGREFVRAALDGDYKKAKDYLLDDSINIQLIEQQESNYLQLSESERNGFKTSSIRPVSIINPYDSVTLFRYYHSANSKDTTELRILRKEGRWLVDLKSVIKM